jgi:hypothetical protein
VMELTSVIMNLSLMRGEVRPNVLRNLYKRMWCSEIDIVILF